MPYFVKTGNWDSKAKGAKGELDLNRLIEVASPKVNLIQGANILITGTYPDLTISSTGGGGGGSVWGLITGTVTDQTDLVSYIASLYAPLARTLTINGTSFDLSSNRTWSVGTVTNFSAGDLSPLFTTTESTTTTTPALSFTLSNAASNTWFGNNGGSPGAPSYNAAANLTEDVSTVLTITGNKTLLASTTIQVKKSSSSQDGYLSSTDWSTFNNKQASGNYITALTGDVTASGPGSVAATLASVNNNIGTFAAVTVNAKGLVTAAVNLSGDITSSGSVATLATVNSNVGTFGSATKSVTAIVNAKGLVTAISEQTLTPALGSITGLGTGVSTALGSNIGSAGSVVTNGGALGTPSSAVLTNATGLPIATGLAVGSGTQYQSARINSSATAWEIYSPSVNPMTAQYDMIVGGVPVSGVAPPARLAVGSEAQSLRIASGVPTWLNDGGWLTPLKVSGSDATTTGQSLIDISGLVTGTLTGATQYEIEAVLYVTTSADTNGQEFGIGMGGSGSAAVVNVILTGTTTSTAATSQTINAAATASSAMNTTSSASGTIIIKGIVTTRGTSPTISIQHLKVTSGTSTIKVGSVLKYRVL